jgi:hypothetical protein
MINFLKRAGALKLLAAVAITVAEDSRAAYSRSPAASRASA